MAKATENGIRMWFAQMKDRVSQFPGAEDVFEHPDRILNCDESAFSLDADGGRGRVVLAERGAKIVQQRATGTKAHITVMCTVSADGNMFPPTMIFPGRGKHPNPKFVDMESFPEAAYIATPNGWQTEQSFNLFVRQLGYTLGCQKEGHNYLLFYSLMDIGHTSDLKHLSGAHRMVSSCISFLPIVRTFFNLLMWPSLLQQRKFITERFMSSS